MAKLKESKKGFKPLGIDLNEDNTLGATISPEGEPIGFYKGQAVDYDVIIDEMEERATDNHSGKKIRPRSLLFKGVDFNKLKESRN